MQLTTKIIHWLSSPWGLGGQVAEAHAEPRYPQRELETYLHYFPIGDRIHIFPDREPERSTESLILGYAINKYRVYSKRDISLGKGGFALKRNGSVCEMVNGS